MFTLSLWSKMCEMDTIRQWTSTGTSRLCVIVEVWRPWPDA